MKVLVFTHMYPSRQHPEYGTFVRQQVISLERAGVDVDVLYVDVKKSKWLYPWSFVPLLRQVLTHRYDLVHAHYVFAGLVARAQFRYPIVLTHHGAEALQSWQAPLCKLASRLVDRTIVVSQQVKDAIGLESSAVVPCGVDFELFTPSDQESARSQLGLPQDKKLLLFVGRYQSPMKRFDLAREVETRLVAQGVDAELVLVSDQPYEKIPLYMNDCDVLLFPSEFEGSPQVVKEAMACDLPVVSADVGDVRDIMAGVEGCYICPRDPASFTDTVRLVLERSTRTNGREKSERYELGSIARRIIKVYEETLAAKKHVYGATPQRN